MSPRQLMRITLVSQGDLLVAPVVAWILCAPKYLVGTMLLGEVAQAALNWLVDNFSGPRRLAVLDQSRRHAARGAGRGGTRGPAYPGARFAGRVRRLRPQTPSGYGRSKRRRRSMRIAVAAMLVLPIVARRVLHADWVCAGW